VRYWLPLLAALVCLIVATRVAGIIGFVLVIAALALVVEAATKAFEQGGRGGRLTDHRQ
jgi:predicted PurR-regulated permease PerM